MNVLFNNALKQSTQIRKDLASVSSHLPSADSQPQASAPTPLTPSALGSLSASLTAFNRTVDEYHVLARQELNPAKQEKALERVRTFRADLAGFRSQFYALKDAADTQQNQQTHNFGVRRTFVATPENPYANSTTVAGSGSGVKASGYGVPSGYGHARFNSNGGGGGAMTGLGSGDLTREEGVLREQSFFASTNTALDEYLARGQAVLSDLGDQRDRLKSVQRRLYSVGNTLGISGDTIRMVERRAKQDKWIFGAGVVVFLLFCWLVLYFLR